MRVSCYCGEVWQVDANEGHCPACGLHATVVPSLVEQDHRKQMEKELHDFIYFIENGRPLDGA